MVQTTQARRGVTATARTITCVYPGAAPCSPPRPVEEYDPRPVATETIELSDGGTAIAYSFADLMRYHGPGSPAGVAIAFKLLERGLPLLAEGRLCERREIAVTTAFGGPGARDAFEMATRAVTDGRYVVDAVLR